MAPLLMPGDVEPGGVDADIVGDVGDDHADEADVVGALHVQTYGSLRHWQPSPVMAWVGDEELWSRRPNSSQP